jgi:ankyrin repeat protein
MKNIKHYTDHLKESQGTPKELGKRLIGILSSEKAPDIEAINALIGAGADLEARDGTGWTPLHQAASRGHTEIAKALIQAGADLEAKNKLGRTPLHIAAYWGRTEAVKALIQAGAELDAKDVTGWTPLNLATLRGHTDAAKALILAGADVSTAFDSLDRLEDLFGGDTSWIPQQSLPPEWRKRHRSRGAFGRF